MGTHSTSPLPDRAPASASRLLERLKIAGHVAVQIALGVVIFFQANYLSCQRYHRWDLSQNRKYTLSDTSRSFVSNLDSDVTLVMAFLGSSELYDDTKGLLSEYERHGAGRIRVEVLDLSRNRERLAALRNEHGIEFTRDAVVILSRDRKKVIAGEELVNRDRSNGRIVEFRGEEVMTSALLEVTEQQQKKIYLVMGKRRGEELQTIARQLTDLSTAQNARVEMLALEGAPEIPSDADAVVVAGNQQPMTEREIGLLADYWHDPDRERQGSLLVFLDPGTRDEAFDAFLRTHGVGPEDDRVMSVASIPGMASRKISDVTVALLDSPGVAPSLARLTTQLTGQTQSLAVELESDLLKADNIHPRPLMLTAQNFWGETEYDRDEIAFSQDQDHAWPIFTAASVERGLPGDANLKQATSRMVVVGNPNVIDPAGNTAKVNADFAMSALNWTLNREQLVGISPRKPAAYVLPVDPAQFSLLQSLIILIIPALALTAAGAVWYFRRA
jgi:hypothetical protein